MPPTHVLLADDGSRQAAPARETAVALAAGGARLTLLHVREAVDDDAAARARLGEATRLAGEAGVACEVAVERPVGITNPGRRIVQYAAAHGADLIVIGARGHGSMRKLIGSVSSYVASHAAVSVLVARPPAPPPPADGEDGEPGA